LTAASVFRTLADSGAGHAALRLSGYCPQYFRSYHDASKGVGILNNSMYKGQVIWGRSKWTRSAANSNIRTVTQVDAGEWIVHQVPSLRIVSDELWDAVHAGQTATNP
jgi:hypothetical protein